MSGIFPSRTIRKHLASNLISSWFFCVCKYSQI